MTILRLVTVYSQRPTRKSQLAILSTSARDDVFMEPRSGVKFIACNMPEANILTIGLLAALAQHERELISRTRWKN